MTHPLDDHAAAQSRINALLEEVEGLRKDAARYRHLVATCNIGFDPSEPWQLVIWEPGTGEDWKAKLDAAIDAAMSAGRSGSGEASNMLTADERKKP